MRKMILLILLVLHAPAWAAELASPTELKQVIDQTLGGAAPAKCDPASAPTQSKGQMAACLKALKMESELPGLVQFAGIRQKNEGLKLPTEMDVEEFVSLIFYTGTGYAAINDALRKGGPAALRVKPCTDIINSALAALPPHADQFVFRGTYLPPEVLSAHAAGKLVKYEAFTSTSAQAPFPGDTQIVIRSRSGHNVKAYSLNPHEDEVLFGAPSCFEVVRHLTPETQDQKPTQEPWSKVDLKSVEPGWKHLLLMQEVPCVK